MVHHLGKMNIFKTLLTLSYLKWTKLTFLKLLAHVFIVLYFEEVLLKLQHCKLRSTTHWALIDNIFSFMVFNMLYEIIMPKDLIFAFGSFLTCILKALYCYHFESRNAFWFIIIISTQSAFFLLRLFIKALFTYHVVTLIACEPVVECFYYAVTY